MYLYPLDSKGARLLNGKGLSGLYDTLRFNTSEPQTPTPEQQQQLLMLYDKVSNGTANPIERQMYSRLVEQHM